MEEKIIEIINYVAPLVAGFITSILIPFIIKRFSIKSLEKKINEVNSGKQLENVNERLDRIEKEILEMRGKRKWINTQYGIL